MKPMARNYAKEINDLHKKIFGAVKMTLERAIKIGELLVKCKADQKHGEWISWMKDNLDFSDRTATQYMKAYDRKDELKIEATSDLSSGWWKLIEHKPKPKPEIEEEDVDEDIPTLTVGDGQETISEEQEVSGLPMARPEENIVDAEEDLGDEVVEDTVVLKQLKKYWSMADLYEKELFIDWLKSRKEI